MNVKSKPTSVRTRKEEVKTYRNYSKSEMIEAVKLVYKASQTTGIPWSSLKRFLNESKNSWPVRIQPQDSSYDD